jgi:anti-sigma B factor antagonist
MMRFEIEEKNDVVIIVLDGEMVGGPDATLLTEKLHNLIEDGKKKIILDMAKVNYMNSSGLGILIGGLTAVRNNGGKLRLLNLASKLKELLRITKLDQVFDLYDDESKAIASLA